MKGVSRKFDDPVYLVDGYICLGTTLRYAEKLFKKEPEPKRSRTRGLRARHVSYGTVTAESTSSHGSVNGIPSYPR